MYLLFYYGFVRFNGDARASKVTATTFDVCLCLPPASRAPCVLHCHHVFGYRHVFSHKGLGSCAFSLIEDDTNE